MENNAELIAQCVAKAEKWLTPSFDESTRADVQAMLDKADKTDLIECFYKDLEFGTGGLRGIMGAGSNRMNIYTVGMATQGFANYLKKNFAQREEIAVVVCHDCRNNSRLFAETVADIFSANGLFTRSRRTTSGTNVILFRLSMTMRSPVFTSTLSRAPTGVSLNVPRPLTFTTPSCSTALSKTSNIWATNLSASASGRA
jgi:hypothetical protein